MKKVLFQFIAAALGAAAGGPAFVYCWSTIDRFFYDTFGIVLWCDGCHAPAMSLLCGFIPVCAALFLILFNKAAYRQGSPRQWLAALGASVIIGGAANMLAVNFVSGAAAAMLIAAITAAAALLGIEAQRRFSDTQEHISGGNP